MSEFTPEPRRKHASHLNDVVGTFDRYCLTEQAKELRDRNEGQQNRIEVLESHVEEVIKQRQVELSKAQDQITELRASLEKAASQNADQAQNAREVIARLEKEISDKDSVIARLRTEQRELEDKKEKLRDLIDDREDEIQKLKDTNTKLSKQIEDLSVSPLTLEQHRRAKALAISREVAKSTGFAKVEVDSGGLLRLAQFIIEPSSEQDPLTQVTQDLVESGQAALAAETAHHNGWLAGIGEVIEWITEHVGVSTFIDLESAGGESYLRDEVIAKIRHDLEGKNHD